LSGSKNEFSSFTLSPGNLTLNYSNDQGPIQKKRIYTSYIQA